MKDTKTSKDNFIKKAGDKIEQLGKKLTNAGHEKIGNAIYNTGDKLEHLSDKKNGANKSKR